MATAVRVEPATAEAVRYIAEHLRAEDRMEVETASGEKPEVVLTKGLSLSARSWVLLVDGEPAVVIGVVPAPNLADTGIPWMLCTERISRARVGVFKASRDLLGVMLQLYGRLYNAADCRNTLHIRWIERLGFTLGATVQVRGFPFRLFHMTRKEPPCATP